MRKILAICFIGILLLFAIAVGCNKEQAGQAGRTLSAAKKVDTTRAVAVKQLAPTPAPAAPVTGLHSVNPDKCNEIDWVWTNPAGIQSINVTINDTLQTAWLTPPTNSYNASGLLKDTGYKITITTSNAAGNSQPVTDVAKTKKC